MASPGGLRASTLSIWHQGHHVVSIHADNLANKCATMRALNGPTSLIFFCKSRSPKNNPPTSTRFCFSCNIRSPKYFEGIKIAVSRGIHKSSIFLVDFHFHSPPWFTFNRKNFAAFVVSQKPDPRRDKRTRPFSHSGRVKKNEHPPHPPNTISVFLLIL